jgi:uncharacterized protein (TIGR00251 family)
MILRVRVTPRASRNIIKEKEGILQVYLTRPAHQGLANAELVETLAGYWKVKKYQVRIIQGLKSRDKLVSVDV